MPARNFALLIGSALLSLLCYHTASRNHYGGLLAGAIGEVTESFVRPVDDRKLFEGAMDGMLRQLDPYSDFITPEELLKFQEELDQKFGGIGIVVEINRDTNRLTVLSPLPDTPALEAGMRAGDQILAIDGKSTEGFGIHDAVDLMRGEAGTALTVTVLHEGDDEPVEMRLHRAIIPIASILGDVRNEDGTWQYTLESDPDIGYIRLVSFGEKTATELAETIQSLPGDVRGLILDIRGNGGGLLKSAIEVCDMFIDQGVIVSIRGRNKRDWRDHSATSETLLPDLPLVVLIDGYSASASEITAACLQDHNRAIVVGDRSWGKGTVQNVMPFEFGRSALKLTIATYWRPSGQNIHRHVDAEEGDSWGVSPNDGWAVNVDNDTRVKIMMLRRDRDKVKDAKDQKDAAQATPEDETQATPEDAANAVDAPTSETSSAPTTTPPATPPAVPDPLDLDISDFVDPQLKRAIEAVRQQIEQAAAA